MMNCPYCGNYDSKVIDSRDVNEGIRRRRQCLSCSLRFTTYERLQTASLFVIKKDERREEFNQDKLLAGIRKACEKRPLPIGTVEKLADDIEADVYRLGKVEIPSSTIGNMVIAGLKRLDCVAYIRFASIYRDFADITALKQEVDTLIGSVVDASIPTSQLPLIPDDKVVVIAKGHQRRR
ncbi:transcriptional regulator NrdR [Chloroflexota bacterium]